MGLDLGTAQMKTKKSASRFLACVVVLLLLLPKSGVAAAEVDEAQKKQIIFLLDGSKSMEKDGQWMAAVDSVCLIAAVLPEDYETALLVYNTDIQYTSNFGFAAEIETELKNIELQGYTNPAAALKAATEMFKENAAEKRVVFISDGEISMKEEEQTQDAIQSYEEAVDVSVAQGIAIDMFILPSEEAPNQILYGSEETSGHVLTKESGQNLEETAIKYLFETLGLKRIELGVSNTDSADIFVELQDNYMQNAKILLTAEQNIENVHISGQCETLEIVEGDRYAVATLTNPLDTQISVDYTLKEKGKAHAYLIEEYVLTVNIDDSYSAETGEFDIEVDIQNHKNKKILETDSMIEAVTISVNEKVVGFDVKDGKAILHYLIPESEKVTVNVDFGQINGIIHCDTSSHTIKLDVPVVEEEPDYRVLWAVLLFLSAIILLLTVCFELKKKKKIGETVQEAEKKVPELVGCDFSGQVTVYLLKGVEEDVPPSSIRLFGRSKKGFSFEWIKDQCGIQCDLKDADKIKFLGGRNYALCIKNTGYSTIAKGREILLRDKKYFLNYGEKVLLIFNDGEVEIELHYKNIKPSER